MNTLQIGANIATPFGLLGLIASIFLIIYLRKLKNDSIALRRKKAAKVSEKLAALEKRYGVNLSEVEKYDSLLKEFDRREASANFLVGSIAVAFTICFLTASVIYSFPNKYQPVTPGDISSLFLVKDKPPCVRNVPRSDNSILLHEWFQKSHNNIKIVSATGISWLLNNQKNDLQDAIKRIPITLLILDYTDKATLDLWNDAEAEYGEGTWGNQDFVELLKKYSQMRTSGAQLTLGLYDEFPSSRFTIFDDRAVSFIVTPNVIGGDRALTYFSEDPYIVRCFEAWYAKIVHNAESRKRLLKSDVDVQLFMSDHARELSFDPSIVPFRSPQKFIQASR